MSELERPAPCPFCGGVLDYYRHEADGVVKEWWSHPSWGSRLNEDKHLLTGCPVYAWRAWTTETDRIAAWNRRVPATPIPTGERR